MKKVKILFIISILSVTYFSTAQGQIRFNVNVNLQPQWGPASYDYVEYYFLPELGIYYSVPNQEFIYPNGNTWRFSNELPPRYRHFNLYSTYKVVINDPKPYLRHDYYVAQYRNYRNKYQDNRRGFKDDNGKHTGWEKNGKARFYDQDYDHEDEHFVQRGRGQKRDYK